MLQYLIDLAWSSPFLAAAGIVLNSTIKMGAGPRTEIQADPTEAA